MLEGVTTIPGKYARMSQGDDGAAASQSDFHTYHYFATEGFLPGYGSLSGNRRSVSTLQLYPHAVVPVPDDRCLLEKSVVDAAMIDPWRL